MRLGVFLRDPEDLLDRGDALAGPLPAVGAERHHAARDRVMTDLPGGRALEDEAAGVLVDDEELVDAGAAAVAGPPALLAALAAEQRDVGPGLDAERVEIGLRRRVGHPAGRAD